jgi:hypothetical protein
MIFLDIFISIILIINKIKIKYKNINKMKSREISKIGVPNKIGIPHDIEIVINNVMF